MQLLPGKLSRTTLGDLLGRLHRSRATGALELSAHGRRHGIHLDRGAIVAVDVDADATPDPRAASPREQLKLELERLFSLLDDAPARDASIRFHVGIGAKTRTRSPEPLDVREVLPGRRRARERDVDPNGEIRTELVSSARERACRLLGVSLDADAAAVRRAFRLAAARTHPDRFPSLPSSERAHLHATLAQLTAAYHLLVA